MLFYWRECISEGNCDGVLPVVMGLPLLVVGTSSLDTLVVFILAIVLLSSFSSQCEKFQCSIVPVVM